MTVKVSELTVDELRELLQETMRDLVEELIEQRLGMKTDPDADLDLRPEVEDSLREYLSSDRRGDDGGEVFRSLGLS
jgi:hypothetical protein